MNKLTGLTMVAMVGTAALTACGSDKPYTPGTIARSNTTLTAGSATSADSSATGGGAGATTPPSTADASTGGPVTVASFCKEVEAAAVQIRAALANPGNVDKAALEAIGKKLSEETKQLMATANANDIQTLTACTKPLIDAYSTAAP